MVRHLRFSSLDRALFLASGGQTAGARGPCWCRICRSWYARLTPLNDTLLRARNQADSNARAVSRAEGWPPFLLIVDVGHVIEVYADFSNQGADYTQFPDGNRYRIKLEDLRSKTIRARLGLIWADPKSLDPSKVSARVTREVSDRVAALAKSYDGKTQCFGGRRPFPDALPVHHVCRGCGPCRHSFSDLLKRRQGTPSHAAPMLKSLWETADAGGFSVVLSAKLKRFNGGLFKEADALPLDEAQLSLLIEAATLGLARVERPFHPAFIFASFECHVVLQLVGGFPATKDLSP